MDSIIDEGLRHLKDRIGEIAAEVAQGELTPRSLSEFEHELHGALGELERKARAGSKSIGTSSRRRMVAWTR